MTATTEAQSNPPNQVHPRVTVCHQPMPLLKPLVVVKSVSKSYLRRTGLRTEAQNRGPGWSLCANPQLAYTRPLIAAKPELPAGAACSLVFQVSPTLAESGERAELAEPPGFAERAEPAVLFAIAEPTLLARPEVSARPPAEPKFRVGLRRRLAYARPAWDDSAASPSRRPRSIAHRRSGRTWEECPDERHRALAGPWPRTPVARE